MATYKQTTDKLHQELQDAARPIVSQAVLEAMANGFPSERLVVVLYFQDDPSVRKVNWVDGVLVHRLFDGLVAVVVKDHDLDMAMLLLGRGPVEPVPVGSGSVLLVTVFSQTIRCEEMAGGYFSPGGES